VRKPRSTYSRRFIIIIIQRRLLHHFRLSSSFSCSPCARLLLPHLSVSSLSYSSAFSSFYLFLRSSSYFIFPFVCLVFCGRCFVKSAFWSASYCSSAFMMPLLFLLRQQGAKSIVNMHVFFKFTEFSLRRDARSKTSTS